MIEHFLRSKNFIPNDIADSIHNIDYAKLYEDGFRLILTDLDNTLIAYDETMPNESLHLWKQKVEEIGFEVIVVSNSPKRRVRKFSEELKVKYRAKSLKPLRGGLKKAIKSAQNKHPKSEIIMIGDQIMTDVFVAKRHGVYAILVKAIKKKTEIWITRMNRRIERRIIRKIEKKDKESFDKFFSEYNNE